MAEIQLFLGVDGGGTHTRAVLADQHGNVLGMGESGPSNYHDIGAKRAGEAISGAVDTALAAAGKDRTKLFSAFFGLAGVLSDADVVEVKKVLPRVADERRLFVFNDAYSALAGALSGRPGIVQIAGTGSVTMGRNAEGQTWRSGGWGDRLADEGSASWMGLEAMRAAVRSFDGRGPRTVLLELVMETLALRHIYEILHRMYAESLERTDIAQLAPGVFACADRGDDVAKEIIKRGAVEVGFSILTTASRLNMTDRVEIGVTGGVFSAGDAFSGPLKQTLDKGLQHYRFVEPELSPVLGSVILAFQHSGLTLSKDMLEKLKTR